MSTPGRAKLQQVLAGLEAACQIVKSAGATANQPAALSALRYAIQEFEQLADRIHDKGGRPPAIWQFLVFQAIIKRPTWSEDEIYNNMVRDAHDLIEEMSATAKAHGVSRSARIPPRKTVNAYIRKVVGNKRRA